MISLIIPAYNEQGIIKNTIENALLHFRGKNEPFELILVDDGSADGTFSILSAYQSDEVVVLKNEKNRGKGYSVRRGVEAARGDYVFFTDADCAYGLDCLDTALKLFSDTNADVVIGSRRIGQKGYEGYSAKRRLMSWFFCLLVNLFLNLRVSDSQCGLKGFKREAAKLLFSKCHIDGFGIDFEFLFLCRKYDMRITEMPVRMRQNGESSIHPVRDSIRMLCDMAKVRKQHGGTN